MPGSRGHQRLPSGFLVLADELSHRLGGGCGNWPDQLSGKSRGIRRPIRRRVRELGDKLFFRRFTLSIHVRARRSLSNSQASTRRKLKVETMAASPLLQASNITKSYVGVHALKSASFELRAGEVHALTGENGAGKSTLIKVITGAVEPDGGVIELDAQTITHNSPRVAKQLGIAAIYQQPALFPELTVAENIALGQEQAAMLGRVDWQARRRRATELLSQVGAKIDVDTHADDLTMPQQQLVEIARSLGAKAKVLIMDEPTASLS